MKRRHQREPRELPHDLISQNILARLPLKPLIRFKLVSKQWYSSISSPQFGHTHYKINFSHPPSPTESLIIQSNNNFHFLSYENDDEFSISGVDFDAEEEKLVLVGSSNGLVCLGSTSGSLFILWNPITREFRKYLDSEMCDDFTKTCLVTWGFGHVSATGDYKIVRIHQNFFCGYHYRIYAFSTKLNKWRRIDQETCHDFTYLQIPDRLLRPGVLVNETLYWMGGKLQGLERKIMSFDLAVELFDTFPHFDVSSPRSWDITDHESCYYRFLFALKGCICKYHCLYYRCGVITVLKHPGETQVIVMNKKLNGAACDSLIGFRNSYKFFKLDKAELAVVDPISRPMKHTPLVTFEGTSGIEISNYCPTLISPNRITTMTGSTI